MMKKRDPRPVHPPGILERIVDRIRGRAQMLVRAGEDLPLLLISYPRGAEKEASALESAYKSTLQALSPSLREPYAAMFRSLPAIVVVVLRARNPCGCLGHHHPRGTESRLTRRLASELGSTVGEIDLAYEDIRQWQPQPISSMALGEMGGRRDVIHFQAAALGVLLHELEHLAFPHNLEQEVRARSDQFYTAAMRELVGDESDLNYGMAAPSPRP